jgi:hypothetical protein
MNSQLINLAISQEDGSLPGDGLSVLETVTYFVLAPTGLFLGISLIVYLAVRPKNARGTAGRAITKIN